MLHLIRADIFRIIKSKGFYITFGLLFLYLLVTVNFEIVGNVGVQDPNVPVDLPDIVWDVEHAIPVIASMSGLLVYFSLPLFIMIIGFDLSRNTYKNILTIGISRAKYFISKSISFAILLIFQILCFYIVACLLLGLKNGWGHLNFDFWQQLFLVMGHQFLNIFAILSVTLIPLYLYSSNVSVVITTVVFPIIVSIVALITKSEFVGYFDFSNVLSQTWNVDLSETFWIRNLIVIFLTIVISHISSFIIFKRRSL